MSAPETRVEVDGAYYGLGDAANFDAQAERYDRNAKDQAVYAGQARELARRIRDAVKKATPITVETLNSGEIQGRLSNGDYLSVERRAGGEYSGKGLFITPAPKGYEWAVARDECGSTVIILRQLPAAVAGGLADSYGPSSAGCAKTYAFDYSRAAGVPSR